MELAEQLEEQGYSEASVEEKVSAYRKQLLSKEVLNKNNVLKEIISLRKGADLFHIFPRFP